MDLNGYFLAGMGWKGGQGRDKSWIRDWSALPLRHMPACNVRATACNTVPLSLSTGTYSVRYLLSWNKIRTNKRA